MKKLFKLLLVLLVCVCLINVNNKHTKAAGPMIGGALTYKDGANGLGLYRSDDSVLEGKGDVWDVDSDNNLVLKDGFDYTTTGSQAIVFNASTDVTIEVIGDVNIRTNSIQDNCNLIDFESSVTGTIKITSVKDQERGVLNLNTDTTTGGGNQSVAMLLHTTKKDNQVIIDGVTVNITGAKEATSNDDVALATLGKLQLRNFAVLNVINNADAAAIDCVVPGNDKSSLATMVEIGSVIKTRSNNVDENYYTNAIMIRGFDNIATELAHLNELYYVNDRIYNVDNPDDPSEAMMIGGCNHLVDSFRDETGAGSTAQIYVGDDNFDPKYKTIEIRAIDDEQDETITFTKDDSKPSNKWGLYYYNEDQEKIDGEVKGRGITWDVKGNDTNPILVLKDNFSIVNNYETGLGLLAPEEDIDLTIKIEGDASIFSVYEASDTSPYVRGIDAHIGNDFNSITFEGAGDTNTIPSLNILPGLNNKETNLNAANRGIQSESAELAFKNGNFFVAARNCDSFNFSTGKGASSAALLTDDCPKITIDNANLILMGGQNVSRPMDPNPTIYLGFSILNEGKKTLTLDIKNNGNLVAYASIASFYFENKTFATNNKVYTYYNGSPVSAKFDKFTVNVGKPMSIYTYMFKNPVSGTPYDYVPCDLLIFTSEKNSNPSPDPGKKDESCEKVIGPTWHWNNDKGVCEEVGVVGTSTR